MKNNAQPMGAKRKATLLGLDIQTILKQSPIKQVASRKKPRKKQLQKSNVTGSHFMGTLWRLYVLIQPV